MVAARRAEYRANRTDHRRDIPVLKPDRGGIGLTSGYRAKIENAHAERVPRVRNAPMRSSHENAPQGRDLAGRQ